MTTLPILKKKKKKSNTHITIIHIKYISREFFGNFYMTPSREIMLEL